MGTRRAETVRPHARHLLPSPGADRELAAARVPFPLTLRSGKVRSPRARGGSEESPASPLQPASPVASGLRGKGGFLLAVNLQQVDQVLLMEQRAGSGTAPTPQRQGRVASAAFGSSTGLISLRKSHPKLPWGSLPRAPLCAVTVSPRKSFKILSSRSLTSLGPFMVPMPSGSSPRRSKIGEAFGD